MSPLIETPKKMEVFLPITTSPIIQASGAIKLSGGMVGFLE